MSRPTRAIILVKNGSAKFFKLLRRARCVNTPVTGAVTNPARLLGEQSLVDDPGKHLVAEFIEMNAVDRPRLIGL